MIYKDFVKQSIHKNMPLAKKIRQANKVSGSSEEAYAFIISALQFLRPNCTDQDLQDWIVDADRDGSIDAIIINKTKRVVELFDFKIGYDFSYQEIKSFKNDVNQYVLNSKSSLVGLAKRSEEKLTQVRRCLKNKYRLAIFIVRNGDVGPSKPTKRILEELKASYSSLETIDFFNNGRLIDSVLDYSLGHGVSSWDISLCTGSAQHDSDCILMRDGSDKRIQTLIARIGLDKVFLLAKNFDQKGINLFNENVRGFINKKMLSVEILRTLKDRPEKFHLYHNGLTFSCSNILKPSGQNYSIANPQVINGCQTVNTIYQTYKNSTDLSNLKKSSVLCRFYVLDSTQIEGVCQATNTQEPIALSDLRSNDRVQKIIEKGLLLKGFTYIRKKSRSKQGITKEKLAQWLYACCHKQPADAKNKKKLLFNVMTGQYKEVFKEERLNFDLLAEVCSLTEWTLEKIKREKRVNYKSFVNAADLHIIAALYQIKNDKGSFEDYYDKVLQITNKVILKLQKKYGPNYDHNKIFTKNKTTWSLIYQSINSLK